MEKTVIVLTIVLATSLAVVSGEEASPRFQRLSRDDYNCTSQGFVCKSCTEVVLCDYEPDGTLVPLEGDTCTGKQTCMEGKCTDSYNEKCHPSVELFKFKCTQEGTFPDPFDCSKYHMCPEKDKDSAIVDCPDGYAFDPRTLMCSIKVPAGKECTRAVKPCQNLGQGPIAGNPRLYYLCRKNTDLDPDLYFPSLLHCAGDLIYIDGRCQDPTMPQLVENGKCTAKGLFYSGRGCKTYNECNVGAAPIPRTCGTNLYFNYDTDTCTAFGCDLFSWG